MKRLFLLVLAALLVVWSLPALPVYGSDNFESFNSDNEQFYDAMEDVLEYQFYTISITVGPTGGTAGGMTINAVINNNLLNQGNSGIAFVGNILDASSMAPGGFYNYGGSGPRITDVTAFAASSAGSATATVGAATVTGNGGPAGDITIDAGHANSYGNVAGSATLTGVSGFTGIGQGMVANGILNAQLNNIAFAVGTGGVTVGGITTK